MNKQEFFISYQQKPNKLNTLNYNRNLYLSILIYRRIYKNILYELFN